MSRTPYVTKDPEKLATLEAFKQNPSLIWQFYHYRREMSVQFFIPFPFFPFSIFLFFGFSNMYIYFPLWQMPPSKTQCGTHCHRISLPTFDTSSPSSLLIRPGSTTPLHYPKFRLPLPACSRLARQPAIKRRDETRAGAPNRDARFSFQDDLPTVQTR